MRRLPSWARARFCPEWPYAEWARGLRAEVEETYREVLEAIAHERTEAGDVNGAIGRYRRLLALEPEREGWHRELMRLYAACGERALALRQYQTLAERLRMRARRRAVSRDARAPSLASCRNGLGRGPLARRPRRPPVGVLGLRPARRVSGLSAACQRGADRALPGRQRTCQERA